MKQIFNRLLFNIPKDIYSIVNIGRMSITQLYMKRKCFQNECNFYEQEGTVKSNPLSLFYANLFKSKFETEINKQLQYILKLWLKYVNDVVAIDSQILFYDDYTKDLKRCSKEFDIEV